MSNLSYDAVRDRLQGIERPESPESLAVEWLIEGVLGVGKSYYDHNAAILCGPELSIADASLRKVIDYGTWRTSNGDQIDANLLDLPEGNEFAIAVSAIAVELIRQGIEDRPLETVFPTVEDFIQQLLGRLAVSGYAVAGLLGELLLLKEVLVQPGYCEGAAQPASIWQGPKHDARDFRHGRNAVEVKTSLTSRRCHTIHSLDQIEARLDENGHAKEALFLLSLGLKHNPLEGVISVPVVVDEILLALERAPNTDVAQEAFLNDLSRWGSPGTPMYDHSRDRNNEQWSTKYSISLEPRLYQVSDERLQLLRTGDLDNKIAERRGLTYRADFPDSVAGSPHNPRAGWPAVVQALLAVDTGETRH